MKLKIFEIPDPILRQKSKPVAAVNEEISTLLKNMQETMYLSGGVGLAAPQVGILKRLIVIDISSKDEKVAPLFLVNPEFLYKSEEMLETSEGCLSVPNVYASVARHKVVRIRFLDEKGKKCELEAADFLAKAIQHEMDHLDGIIFIDYVSPLKRKLMLKKLEKNRKKEQEEKEKSSCV